MITHNGLTHFPGGKKNARVICNDLLLFAGKSSLDRSKNSDRPDRAFSTVPGSPLAKYRNRTKTTVKLSRRDKKYPSAMGTIFETRDMGREGK